MQSNGACAGAVVPGTSRPPPCCSRRPARRRRKALASSPGRATRGCTSAEDALPYGVAMQTWQPGTETMQLLELLNLLNRLVAARRGPANGKAKPPKLPQPSTPPSICSTSGKNEPLRSAALAPVQQGRTVTVTIAASYRPVARPPPPPSSSRWPSGDSRLSRRLVDPCQWRLGGLPVTVSTLARGDRAAFRGLLRSRGRHEATRSSSELRLDSRSIRGSPRRRAQPHRTVPG
jgi:hypothetical protein